MKKKIKLRDMSKEQWDKNRSVLCKLLSHECCENCIFQWVGGCSDSIYRSSWINHKDCYSDKVLDQEVEIEMPDILNEQEKKYLSNIIRPFKNRVISIRKCMIKFGDKEDETFYYIHIKTRSKTGILLEEDINLPCFNNKIYERMEIAKDYTLEELEL